MIASNFSTISHVKNNAIQLHESKEILSVILTNYHTFLTNDLNKAQRQFVSLIDATYQSLLETVVVFPNCSENLWKALDDTKLYDWSNIAFEDFPENSALKNSILALDRLEAFVQPKSKTSKFLWIFKEGVFSNLSLMRLILQASCTCEQYWVPADNGEIDCVIVKSDARAADIPIIIFCNPNGGLYEYSCYQNQWLEFYVNNGIDLCLWNYRGYGRTKGTPTADSLRNDGQTVYNFLVKVKMYEKIGLHGQSIGAMVATYLARKNEADFLFADRTFSNLDSLVSEKVKLLNKNLFKCFSKWNDSTVDDFLAAKCYKILTCDAEDQIVLEQASLKAGVAALQNCNELDSESINELVEAINSISELAVKLRPNDVKEQRDSNLEVTYNSIYALVSREIESHDDENVAGIVYTIYNALSIDSGGLSLSSVMNGRQLKTWVRVIQVWGSFLPGEGAIGREKTIEKLKISILALAEIFKENEFIINPAIVSLCRQARLLKNGLSKIQKCIENYNRVNTDELTIRDSKENCGFLVPINCGHNGSLNSDEKKIVAGHLEKANFIFE